MNIDNRLVCRIENGKSQIQNTTTDEDSLRIYDYLLEFIILTVSILVRYVVGVFAKLINENNMKIYDYLLLFILPIFIIFVFSLVGIFSNLSNANKLKYYNYLVVFYLLMHVINMALKN